MISRFGVTGTAAFNLQSERKRFGREMTYEEEAESSATFDARVSLKVRRKYERLAWSTSKQ